MRVFSLSSAAAVVGAIALSAASALADSDGAAAVSAYRVGQTFAYTLHGSMSQAINGHDPYGKKIKQPGTPAIIDGTERIVVQKISPSNEQLTLKRTGTIVATVGGKHKPLTRSGVTVVSASGSIVHDANKVGGVFLLPLPFFGDHAVKAGAPLTVGDAWSGKLGIRLFGMIASPLMRFSVVQRSDAPGTDVYEIDGSGPAPMKEPIVSNAGYALGTASGTAWVSLHAEYDATNRRVISLSVDVRDTLQLFGSNNKLAGTVRDTQKYAVSLQSSLAGI